MQNSELLWDYDPNVNVVLLNEKLPCAWMWLDMVLPSKYVAEERRWPGRVLLVFTMQLPAARPASPQLDHTHINAGKADQQFCLHFFGKYQSWIFSHKFKFEIKYMSIKYIAIAVLT